MVERCAAGDGGDEQGTRKWDGRHTVWPLAVFYEIWWAREFEAENKEWIDSAACALDWRRGRAKEWASTLWPSHPYAAACSPPSNPSFLLIFLSTSGLQSLLQMSGVPRTVSTMETSRD